MLRHYSCSGLLFIEHGVVSTQFNSHGRKWPVCGQTVCAVNYPYNSFFHVLDSSKDTKAWEKNWSIRVSPRWNLKRMKVGKNTSLDLDVPPHSHRCCLSQSLSVVSHQVAPCYYRTSAGLVAGSIMKIIELNQYVWIEWLLNKHLEKNRNCLGMVSDAWNQKASWSQS